MRKRRRKNEVGEQFVSMKRSMLESPAYQVLGLSARRVLNRIEIENCRHGGAENGRLPVTFDDFQRYGIHRHAIAPAIRELVALGFIEITKRGRAGNAEFRKPSLYRLTYLWSENAYGFGTDEWRKIETIEDATTIAAAARRARPSRIEKQKPVPVAASFQ